LVYRDRRFQRNNHVRHLGDILENQGLKLRTEVSGNDCGDFLNSIHVLDVKKSAEIEAMFKTLKLDGERRCSEQESRPEMRRTIGAKATTSVDFQSSLGYLP
jgi:hypothetical protein